MWSCLFQQETCFLPWLWSSAQMDFLLSNWIHLLWKFMEEICTMERPQITHSQRKECGQISVRLTFIKSLQPVFNVLKQYFETDLSLIKLQTKICCHNNIDRWLLFWPQKSWIINPLVSLPSLRLPSDWFTHLCDSEGHSSLKQDGRRILWMHFLIGNCPRQEKCVIN